MHLMMVAVDLGVTLPQKPWLVLFQLISLGGSAFSSAGLNVVLYFLFDGHHYRPVKPHPNPNPNPPREYLP